MKAKSRKIFLAAVSIALIGVMGAAGTFAYLQDSTEDVVNTFETNEVKVTLKETTDNQYNIIPGTSESKDPKVTVDNTVDSYVYVEVTDETQGLVTWVIDNGWTKLDGYDNVYYREVAADADVKVFSVLAGDKVSYAASLTNEDMYTTDADGNTVPKSDVKLTFQASAVQKTPFEDPVKAYSAANPLETDSAETLTSALSAGKSVKLTNDIEAAVEIPEGASVIIDLNGKTLSTADSADTITVANGAELTLIGGGTVKNDASGKAAVYNNGTVTVEEGSFETNGYYLFLQHGTMTINSGTFTSTSDGSSLIDNGYYNYTSTNERSGYVEGTGQANPKLVINGGVFDGGMNTVKNDDGGILEINGGTFSNATQVPLFNVHIAVVNGGTFNTPSGTDKTSIYNRKYDDAQDIGQLTINGGTFNANYVLETDGDPGTITINDGTFNNEIGVVNPGGQPIDERYLTIHGGTFKNR